ncbi:ead/Ea22-like family protein [Enterobacter sp. BNK-13]|uniref:ead/Ea22-like family protein n=1 Tax=Enterobacter sp. BNK-13 TaxID=3376150 RepID=UPI003B4364FE
MSNIDKQALTAESARESGNIILIVAARMARRELFTPLHYVSELPQKVVSMRVFREALERSEETIQREVCKIVDGHDRMQKKLKEAEAKLEASEKRIAELEVREDGNQFLVVRHPGKAPVIKHSAGDLEGFLRQLLEHEPMATIDIVTHRYYGVGGQWVQDADEYLQMIAAAAGKGD